ncbi:MAG TPA: sterol desaturase family protein [Noviherbaspirillum sp.]|uniref:sterol desaturase family protein n=1 Tax=Noviherbaspirillum sp. TaxID=1926288 RepID=UPI002DDCF1D4|nr:sterol desaturase family protein [Noviherbaspirillum sp.]HEV2609678.1 sterol desaturase family protein [Noviherbaspirillum sp.]
MQEKVITLATPVFFLLIFIELAVGLLRHRNTYRLNDAINSISLGVLSQISGVFMRLLRIGIYAWLLEHVALFRLPADSLWVWVSGLLLYDFCYYWLHRMGHEVNILWAAHVVHHQSEDYNLSTALRQTSSGALLGWIFYIPMAVLGYPLEVFAAVALIDLLYQFWVHTQQIGRLGWFDRVFVSPSNHRVHHAVNDVYLDKNYGGILILWDRMFGTFIEERDDEPVVYGTRSPLRSWNPLWANIEVYKSIAKDAWHTRRLRDKLRLLFARPGWRPADIEAVHPKVDFDIRHALYNPELTRSEQIYCLAQFSVLLLTTTHFLAVHNTIPGWSGLAYAAWLGGGLWIIGGLMERASGYSLLESVRLVGTAIGVLVTGSWFGAPTLPPIVQSVIVVSALISLAAFWMVLKSLPAPHGHFSHQ